MKDFKDDTEYKKELFEWENLFLRLKILFAKKQKVDPLTWGVDMQKVDEVWQRVRDRLKKIYTRENIS